MSIFVKLSTMALGQMIPAVGDVSAPAVEGVVLKIAAHFTDHSQRVPKALKMAADRAWRAVEISLEGESFWRRFDAAEDKALREQLRAFLAAAPLPEDATREEFRTACVAELRAARKAELFDEQPVSAEQVAAELRQLARFDRPELRLEGQWHFLSAIGAHLRDAGHPTLAQFVELRPASGTPLLVVCVRYFFRRAVEEDDKLFQGLTFDQLDNLTAAQMQGFGSLLSVLATQSDRLDGIAEAVLDVRAEQAKMGELGQDIYREVLALQKRLDLMQSELRPRDSLSIRNDEERRLVKQLLGRYRTLPKEERETRPALLNAVGQLQVAAGDFQAATHEFQEVARIAHDPHARAEGHLNAYRAALESRQFEVALAELMQAVEAAPERFAPFPLKHYAPKKILGAGGFGVAFLCEDHKRGGSVVVKAVTSDHLDRPTDDLLNEAKLIAQLQHESIVRVLACGYASKETRTRPYLVMQYFPGSTLEARVRHKPLGVDDLLLVARLMAEGLHAAHDRGILHRDVKPANVLVRKGDGGWQVKLIDFGLAVQQQAVSASISMPAAFRNSLSGQSITGTLDYAAPEQLGKLPGVRVSPASDVYGFARTCCFALFGTPNPRLFQMQSLPKPLMELLDRCQAENPKERPRDFKDVLAALQAVAAPRRTTAKETMYPPKVLPVSPVTVPTVPVLSTVAREIPVAELPVLREVPPTAIDVHARPDLVPALQRILECHKDRVCQEPGAAQRLLSLVEGFRRQFPGEFATLGGKKALLEMKTVGRTLIDLDSTLEPVVSLLLNTVKAVFRLARDPYGPGLRVDVQLDNRWIMATTMNMGGEITVFTATGPHALVIRYEDTRSGRPAQTKWPLDFPKPGLALVSLGFTARTGLHELSGVEYV